MMRYISIFICILAYTREFRTHGRSADVRIIELSHESPREILANPSPPLRRYIYIYIYIYMYIYSTIIDNCYRIEHVASIIHIFDTIE